MIYLVIYIHDGSFEGFLTCIYESYYNIKKPEEILSQENFNNELFYDPIYIKTDNQKSQKVYGAMLNKLGNETLYNLYYAFLCSDKGNFTALYKYIRFAFKVGPEVNLHLHNPIVFSIIKMRQKVEKEKHRMLGFIRFKYLEENLLYSSIEPDNDILTLVAPHFQRRLSNEYWIIHDLKRHQAVIYNKKHWIIAEDYEISSSPSTKDCYEDLWKEYFKSTTIKERTNLKLQSRSMPKRYWKHLLEMDLS